MTFYEWLIKQTKRDDVVGDLAQDARRDKNFPKHATNLTQLRNHLTANGAGNPALRALREAYAEWSRSK